MRGVSLKTRKVAGAPQANMARPAAMMLRAKTPLIAPDVAGQRAQQQRQPVGAAPRPAAGRASRRRWAARSAC